MVEAEAGKISENLETLENKLANQGALPLKFGHVHDHINFLTLTALLSFEIEEGEEVLKQTGRPFNDVVKFG